MNFVPSWLNPFDVLIAFAMLAGIIWGFVRGLVRSALGLAVIYIATILAVNFYIPVGKWLRYLSGRRVTDITSQAVAFILILVVIAVALHLALRRTYKDTEWPGIRHIDQLGGLVLGFFLTVFWIGLALLLIAFVLGTPTLAGEELRQNLLSYFHSSTLIPIYYRFLPVAVATLKPWVPRGQLPDIFVFQLP
jgi:membrane protein required for colicin V production